MNYENQIERSAEIASSKLQEAAWSDAPEDSRSPIQKLFDDNSEDDLLYDACEILLLGGDAYDARLLAILELVKGLDEEGPCNAENAVSIRGMKQRIGDLVLESVREYVK